MRSRYKVGQREIVWGIAAQALGIGAGILLLPFIVRYLSKEEVALWVVFGTLAGLVGLLDFGFQTTITRQAAYVYSGVRDLYKEGIASFEEDKGVDHNLLATIITLSRRIYIVAGSVAALLLLGGGTWYVLWLVREWSSAERLLAATGWILYATGTMLTLYFGYYGALLQARGDVTAANKASVFSRALYLLAGVAALIGGGGLLGLGFASLVAALTLRGVTRTAFLDADTRAILQNARVMPRLREYFWVLWHNASRLGVNFIGAFLIQRSNILVVATMVGLEEGASFIFSSQLFGIAVALSGTLMGIYLPRLSMLQAVRSREELQRTFAFVHMIGLLAYCGAAILLVTCGPYLLEAIGSRSHLMAPGMCVMMAAYLLLEVNHGGHATMITTGNRVPFVRAAIYSGVAIVALSALVLRFTGFGIWGLMIVQAAVQALYNNWKWPLENVSSLGLTLRRFFAIGMAEVWRRVYR